MVSCGATKTALLSMTMLRHCAGNGEPPRSSTWLGLGLGSGLGLGLGLGLGPRSSTSSSTSSASRTGVGAAPFQAVRLRFSWPTLDAL